MIDKRSLKRQYLETKTRAGVYTIRNLKNGKVMIDGSNNAQAAINRHRFELRIGSHQNPALSADWKEFGEDAFVFEIIDKVKHRDSPDFDARQELEELITLWREEINCDPDDDYHVRRATT